MFPVASPSPSGGPSPSALPLPRNPGFGIPATGPRPGSALRFPKCSISVGEVVWRGRAILNEWKERGETTTKRWRLVEEAFWLPSGNSPFLRPRQKVGGGPRQIGQGQRTTWGELYGLEGASLLGGEELEDNSKSSRQPHRLPRAGSTPEVGTVQLLK